MALQVDRNRQAADVGGVDLHMHRQSGGAAAEALGPNAETVDAREKVGFDLGHIGSGMGLSQGAQQGALGYLCRHFQIAADAHPH